MTRTELETHAWLPHCQLAKCVFLLGIAQNFQNYTKKLCLPTLYPYGMGQLQNEIFFAWIE